MELQYKKYNPVELQKLQNVQLEILKDFITLCEKYNLSYIMDGGSGIGVVRHQGFIPWDDDVDISMPRKDYNIFVAVLEKEMGDRYKILTPEIDERYACNVTKMQKRGTKFVPYISKDMKCDQCISIDIFPLDKVSKNKKQRSLQLKKTWILNKLIFLCGTGEPIIPLEGISKKVASMIIKITHRILKSLHVSPKTLYRILESEEQKYNNTDSHYYNNFRSIYASHQFISEKELFPLKQMEFEGVIVNVPNEYHTYLTRIFGDYMQLPPEEKRVNHSPYLLDFGKEK